ncbi:MAG: class I SAM-dependent methyltransferase [Bacteroidota bacterium]
MEATASREEWPMDSYIESWKVFREISDENQITAEALVALPDWPTDTAPLRILDVGCGDGRLIRLIALRCTGDLEEIRLLDPDLQLLREAERHVRQTLPAVPITTRLEGISEGLPEVYEGIDVILGVHLVYLLKDGEFERMIESLPSGIPLFVVLDRPQSLFTRLWNVTAPSYLARSQDAHATVQALNPSVFRVREDTITSRIRGLSGIRRPIRETIMSLLCYCEYPKLSAAKQEQVQGILSEFTEDDVTLCDSTCYSIVRR